MSINHQRALPFGCKCVFRNHKGKDKNGIFLLLSSHLVPWAQCLTPGKRLGGVIPYSSAPELHLLWALWSANPCANNSPRYLFTADETGSYKPPVPQLIEPPSQKAKKPLGSSQRETHSKPQTDVGGTHFPGLGNRKPSSQHWLPSDHPVHRKLVC